MTRPHEAAGRRARERDDGYLVPYSYCNKEQGCILCKLCDILHNQATRPRPSVQEMVQGLEQRVTVLCRNSEVRLLW